MLAVVYVATVGVLGALIIAGFGARARASGESVYEYRRGLLMAMDVPEVHKPRIVWLADSTLYDDPNYFQGVVALLPGFQQVRIALPGLDPFSYFCLIDRVLSPRPRGIIMIANLRLLRPDPRRSDLVSMLDADALLEATTLPLHSVNVTLREP